MEILNHNVLGEMPKMKSIRINFEGQLMLVREGQTVAAALMANGVHKLGYNRKSSQPRGVYCGNGRCQSCIMTIDGLEHVRSCQTLVREGMSVKLCTSDPDVRGTL